MMLLYSIVICPISVSLLIVSVLVLLVLLGRGSQLFVWLLRGLHTLPK